MMTRAMSLSVWVALGLAAALSIAGCGGQMQVKGISMEPAIKDGERIATNPDAFKERAPQRGDIVIVDRDKVKFVRRVIGMPGETITIEKGAVYINGTKLEEPYLAPDTPTESATREFLVPANSYFVLGDNRGRSSDSRNWQGTAFVTTDQITAKVQR